MRGSQSVKWVLFVGAVGLMAVTGSRASAKPLKVYILAGQSNMQGHVNVSTFDSMADDPKTAPILKEMRGADGKAHVCDKVWISSIGCAGDDTTEQTGKLTTGFGASSKEIGPEFTFGITMEKQLGEPALIIKTSWGGRSLHTDFRPPCAGPYVISKRSWDWAKQHGENLKEVQERVDKTPRGVSYHLMVEHVRRVLADIKRVVPDHDPKEGFELAGFVWFQGFNDMIDEWTYDDRTNGGYAKYEMLLEQFIRDVRKDLLAPKMPFVIGVMGIGGEKEGPPQSYFRQFQAAPAALPEFQGNVVAVRTAPFWDDDLAALRERMDIAWPKVDARVADELKTNPQANSGENKMKIMGDYFTPEEWKRVQGISNHGYHYLGAAKIIAPIGKAFAEALMDLGKKQ